MQETPKVYTYIMRRRIYKSGLWTSVKRPIEFSTTQKLNIGGGYYLRYPEVSRAKKGLYIVEELLSERDVG